MADAGTLMTRYRRWLAQFTRPDHLIMQRHTAGGTTEILPPRPKPSVIEVSDRVLYDDQGTGRAGFGEKMLRAWGYRFVYRKPELRTQIMARPWFLWMLHIAGHAIYEAWYVVLGWLYRHRVIYLAIPEGVMVRMRDLRPWLPHRVRPEHWRGWRD